jgi:hypothetical protein
MIEKEQAIQIIIEEYENGFSPTDIAQNLSQHMGVPYEPVYQFVMRTLSEQAENRPVTPQAERISSPGPVPQPPNMAKPEDETPLEPESPLDPVALFLGGSQPDGEILVEAESERTSPAQAEMLTGKGTSNLKTLEQDPEVEKFILQLLSKNRKTDDIVLAVCERTGLDWNDSGRLVARIETKNQKILKSKQNRLPMILSLIALVTGGLLLFAGITEGFRIYTVVQRAQSTEEMVMTAASQEFLRRAFWSLITGGGLLIGGAVGFFLSLRSTLE